MATVPMTTVTIDFERVQTMSNMSYCRFQNTALDLQDCLYAMEAMQCGDEERLSYDERRGFASMLDIIGAMVDRIGEQLGLDTEEVIERMQDKPRQLAEALNSSFPDVNDENE